MCRLHATSASVRTEEGHGHDDILEGDRQDSVRKSSIATSAYRAISTAEPETVPVGLPDF